MIIQVMKVSFNEEFRIFLMKGVFSTKMLSEIPSKWPFLALKSLQHRGNLGRLKLSISGKDKN